MKRSRHIFNTTTLFVLCASLVMTKIMAQPYEAKLLLKAPMDEDGIYSESYPWAMAAGATHVFIGTAANVLCGGAYPKANGNGANEKLPPREDKDMRCAHSEVFPGAPYDWRPPAIWSINRATGASVRLDVNTDTLLGFRSAGVLGDGKVVLISEGVRNRKDFGNLVAMVMDDQGNRLKARWTFGNGHSGSDGAKGLSMPRNGVSLGGSYYFPFQDRAEGDAVMFIGKIDPSGHFSRIGRFPGRGGVVGSWQGRLVFGSWTNGKFVARLYVSNPELTAFKPFFSFDQYEPDLAVALTYNTGALTEMDGWLYFGTINAPFLATGNEILVNGPAVSPPALLTAERAIAIFRARNLDGDLEVELLYGRKALPAHLSLVPINPLHLRPGLWAVKKTGFTPKCGSAGFGDPFNRYTWSMATWNHQVFIGTMDMSTQTGLLSVVNKPIHAGGDIYAMPENGCANTITKNGFGNPYLYGFRNLVATKEGVYAGGANPYNLTGGFEIWLIK